jgi:DNA repair exonuclease SbcCD ATPase subunit
MADETLNQVARIQEGGVWDDQNILGDDTWSGEVATKSEPLTTPLRQFTPKTPSQEDKEIINRVVKDPNFIAAITREIERKMLRDSGRSVGVSILQQVTNEREESIKRIRDWITTAQQTNAVAESNQSKEAASRISSLEEKIVSLELKLGELMSTAVSHKSQEKEMIEQAYKILQENRREENGSQQTPSEITRMEERTNELDSQINRFQQQLNQKPVSAPPAQKNRRKFGTLF